MATSLSVRTSTLVQVAHEEQRSRGQLGAAAKLSAPLIEAEQLGPLLFRPKAEAARAPLPISRPSAILVVVMPLVENSDGTVWIDINDMSEVDEVQAKLVAL